jgi:predicted homoserine dehydrogenase-like protein
MLYEALRELEEQRRPIRVGVIGAGTFATQIITQMCRMVGMRAAVVADLKRERATRALNLGGIVGERVTLAETTEAINQAIDQGRSAATSSAAALIDSHVDVVIEATGLVDAAIRHGYDAIQARKHLVMVTVEADVLVGYLLKQLAEENGVIYSMAYGDEPALAYELWDWAKTAKALAFCRSTERQTRTMCPGCTASRGKTTTFRCSGHFSMGPSTPSR